MLALAFKYASKPNIKILVPRFNQHTQLYKQLICVMESKGYFVPYVPVHFSFVSSLRRACFTNNSTHKAGIEDGGGSTVRWRKYAEIVGVLEVRMPVGVNKR